MSRIPPKQLQVLLISSLGSNMLWKETRVVVWWVVLSGYVTWFFSLLLRGGVARLRALPPLKVGAFSFGFLCMVLALANCLKKKNQNTL